MFLLSCSYRAPIASLDCMEEFQSTNEHLTQGAPQTKEQLLQSLSQHTPLTASNQGPLVSRQSSVTPGLRYRNLGKSGLRVSNVGLGKCPCPSVRPSRYFGTGTTERIWMKFGIRATYHTLSKVINLGGTRSTLSLFSKDEKKVKCTLV